MEQMQFCLVLLCDRQSILEGQLRVVGEVVGHEDTFQVDSKLITYKLTFVTVHYKHGTRSTSANGLGRGAQQSRTMWTTPRPHHYQVNILRLGPPHYLLVNITA